MLLSKWVFRLQQSPAHLNYNSHACKASGFTFVLVFLNIICDVKTQYFHCPPVVLPGHSSGASPVTQVTLDGSRGNGICTWFKSSLANFISIQHQRASEQGTERRGKLRESHCFTSHCPPFPSPLCSSNTVSFVDFETRRFCKSLYSLQCLYPALLYAQWLC